MSLVTSVYFTPGPDSAGFEARRDNVLVSRAFASLSGGDK
jgi:hypothetical protein